MKNLAFFTLVVSNFALANPPELECRPIGHSSYGGKLRATHTDADGYVKIEFSHLLPDGEDSRKVVRHFASVLPETWAEFLLDGGRLDFTSDPSEIVHYYGGAAYNLSAAFHYPGSRFGKEDSVFTYTNGSMVIESLMCKRTPHLPSK